jgi:hypothetical protein
MLTLALAACLHLSPAFQEDASAEAPSLPLTRTVRECARALVDRQEDLSLGERERGDTRRGVAVEWPYEGVYRERVPGAALPQIPAGYRVGGTSIGGLFLLEALPYLEEGEREAARAALVRALEFVLDSQSWSEMSAGFNRQYDVRGWGHAYGLWLLLRARHADALPEALRERLDGAIRAWIEVLESTEIEGGGGWNYARRAVGGAPAAASSFMTASTLITLFLAEDAGFEVDGEVVERALATLEAARVDGAAHAYGYTSRGGLSKVPGTIGRSPMVELALELAGRGEPARLLKSVEAFFEHWDELEARRQRTGTHEGDYGIAPYYFFYAQLGAALAIERCPEQAREALRQQLIARLVQTRDQAGTWNDRVFDRSAAFGTSMVGWALLAPELEPLPSRR